MDRQKNHVSPLFKIFCFSLLLPENYPSYLTWKSLYDLSTSPAAFHSLLCCVLCSNKIILYIFLLLLLFLPPFLCEVVSVWHARMIFSGSSSFILQSFTKPSRFMSLYLLSSHEPLSWRLGLCGNITIWIAPFPARH